MSEKPYSHPTVLEPIVEGTSVQVHGWLPDAERPYYDANHLLTLPGVDSVHITGTPHAENLDALTKIGPLKHLHLEIYKIDQVDILERIDASELVSLHLIDTAPRKLDLSVLERFKRLESLSIDHEKNLSAVGELPSLKELTIRPIAKVPCEFISKLSNLERLKLVLGSQRDIRDLVLPNLKRLEIVRVRYFEDIGDLSRFPMLEELHVENQPRLIELRASSIMKHFQKLTVFACRALEGFEGRENLISLNEVNTDHPSLSLTGRV